MKTTTSKRLTYIMEAKKLRQVDILEKAKPICEKYESFEKVNDTVTNICYCDVCNIRYSRRSNLCSVEN